MARFADFRSFITGAGSKLHVQGFRVTGKGDRIVLDEQVEFAQFVPHEREYYLRVIEGIEALYR
ncbi:hypothetical protein [Paenibacillus piscarius]|uniref:hypothetical protein n=1 Tax=Paenibacillus piscarius TaxID=1089681 RepID=UPI001EE7A480|nr:hypothetical protein [Paenibacillus piscarius]